MAIVMQRLHEDDLVGRLLEKGGWEHLKIAAIAEQDEEIKIGVRRVYKRKAGAVIDPRRESLDDLAGLRQSMGELFFSAQYQQAPIPLAGNLIKADWFKEYDVSPTVYLRRHVRDQYRHGDEGRATCRLFCCHRLA